MKINIATIVAALALFLNGGWNFVKVQERADLSPEARNSELVKYAGGPIGSAAGLLALVFGTKKIIGTIDPDGSLWARLTRDSKPPPSPIEQPVYVPPSPTATATVIALREPNIDLQIVLSGDAANDAEGRKRIGAVTEWYASGRKGGTA